MLDSRIHAKLLFLGLFFFLNISKAAVWAEENQWSEAWEQKYKEWVQINTGANFFSSEKRMNGSPNPYYGIRVDCADLVYTHRVIFAFENKLPFAMVNPVNPSGALINNQLKRFDSTPEGTPRLKVFLTWIYDLLSTYSLPNDTYSIGFNSVGSGTIILTSKKNHHSWTIKSISRTGNPTLVFNSVIGRESGLKVQERSSWPNPYWIFEPEVDKKDETKSINIYLPGSYAGFRYWRPVEYLKQAERSVPGFNDEQHTVGLSKWKTNAQTALAKVKETFDQVVMRLLKDACADFKQRVDAVLEAEDYKTKLATDFKNGKSAAESDYIREFLADPNRPSDNRCMTYKAFDQFSTPSRDRRLVDAILLARAYLGYGLEKYGEKEFNPENLKMYKTIFPFIKSKAAEEAKLDTAEKPFGGFCSYKIDNTVGGLSLAELKRRFFSGQFSSNPNEAMSGRFGFKKTAKDLGATCPSYDLSAQAYDFDKIEQEMMKEVLSSPLGI